MANLKRTFKGTPYQTTRVKASYRMEKEQVDEIRNYLYDSQTERCILYGRTKLDEAFMMSQYWDRTTNLSNSFAFAVYFNGKRVWKEHFEPKTASVTITQTGTGDQLSGHEEADKFFSNYSPRSRSGWEIVWVAAMYYAAYLERGVVGKGARTRTFLVLSSILNDVNSDFGASNVKIVDEFYKYTPTNYGY